MAAALLALNQVFGDCYQVDAEEVDDPKAFEEHWPKEQFVFDMQTHHVDVSRKWYDDSATGRGIKNFFRLLRPEAKSDEHVMELLNRAHYVKEVFGDSDTVMSVISGVPSRDWDKNPLPPDQMVATRKFVNDLAGSRRVLSHGLLRPNLGKPELEEMERQIKELKIEAWKMYTGAEIGEKAWRMDDEKVAYPFWEKTKALGIKNLCVHKGLPLGAFNEEACRPLDLEKAAKDWPDLNFIVYHSGFRGYGWLAKGTGHPGRGPADRTTRRRSPGSATSCGSSSGTRTSRTSTSSWAGRSASCRWPRRGSACTCSPRWSRSPAPTTSSGAPTRSGTAARRARSSGCAGSRSPTT